MRFYFIRHGVSESNQGMTYSEPTTPLAKEASGQLQSVKRHLKTMVFKEVVASDFRRTMETARLIGFPDPLPEPRLRERDFGIFTGHTHEACLSLFPDAYAAFQHDPVHYRIPNGESFDDLCDRVWDFLDEKSAHERAATQPIEGFRYRPLDVSTMLIVAHFNVVAAAVAWVFDDRSTSHHIVTDNGGALMIDVRGPLKTIFLGRP